MYFEVFLLFCVCAGVQSNLVSDLNLELCSRDDTDCLTRVADKFFTASIKGDPSLHIETLDPVHHERIEGKFLITEYTMFNSTFIDFKTCHVVKTKLTLEKNTFDFQLFCPHIYMFSKYLTSGYLIIVPIEGDGDLTLDCKDYYINIETETKTIHSNDGKRHLQFKKFKAVGNLQGGMAVHMTNLFNGKNDQLADAALKFANEYWQPVANEFQGPLINANVRKIIKNLNKYLKRVELGAFYKG